jgi:hypothetical protein
VADAARPARFHVRRWHGASPAFALFVILVVLLCWQGRWGPDWPAQEFRAWSAAHAGLTAWTNAWYGGVALPGYSVVYPVVAGTIGAAATGAIAVLAAWVGAMRFAPTAPRRLQLCFQLSVGWVLLADLLIGQVPFLLGVACGIWALRGVADRHPVAAVLAGAACSLASPLTGGLLLLAATGVAAAVGLRRAAPLLAATSGLVVSATVEGGGGSFPFVLRIAGWIAVFVAATLLMTRRGDRPIRVFVGCYAVSSVALLMFANPIGGNVARYGQLVALPLLWFVFPRLRWRHWTAAVGLAAAAALWSAWPAATALAHGADDPSQHASYYTGLLTYLHRHQVSRGRVEVVFTREHWESFLVARKIPLARGWERQTDLAANAVLYRPLSGADYNGWLRDNAVGYVALPDVAIDYGGRAEARLLKHPPAYLQRVWHDRHWTLWRVRDAQPIAVGSAQLRTLGAASFVLDFRRAGTVVVRIHASPMWTATAGEACVGSRGAWLTVSAPAPGRVTVRSQVHLGGAAADDRRCS